MPDAINEEVKLCPNPSPSTTPNASTFGKSLREDNASSKSLCPPSFNRSQQTSLNESFQSSLLEDA